MMAEPMIRNRCGAPFLSIPPDLFNEFRQGGRILVTDNTNRDLQVRDRVTYDNGNHVLGGAEVVEVNGNTPAGQNVVIKMLT